MFGAVEEKVGEDSSQWAMIRKFSTGLRDVRFFCVIQIGERDRVVAIKIISTDSAQEMQKGSCQFLVLGSQVDFMPTKTTAAERRSWTAEGGCPCVSLVGRV